MYVYLDLQSRHSISYTMPLLTFLSRRRKEYEQAPLQVL